VAPAAGKNECKYAVGNNDHTGRSMVGES